MPTRFLLDTNTISYAIRGQFPAIRKRLVSTPNREITLSVFTQAELMYGLARNVDSVELRKAVMQFLQEFRVIAWDSDAATAYGALRAAQERKEQRLSQEDLMIASHALSQALILVTNDPAFSFVDGLKTEDWTAG